MTAEPRTSLPLLALLWSAALRARLCVRAQTRTVAAPDGWAEDAPDLASLVDFARGESDLRVAVERYVADRAAVGRRYPVPYSPVRIERMRDLAQSWLARLESLDFNALNHEGQIDYILLRNNIEHDLASLVEEERRREEMAPLVPFFDALRRFQEERYDRKRVDPRAAAGTLDALDGEIRRLSAELAAEARRAGGTVEREGITPVVALRAANHIDALRRVLADWNTFYDGYDPIFSWWVREPFARVDEALRDYA